MKIWTDPWIPRAWSRQVITPRGQSLLTHVSELISPITGAWDEELVNASFWPDDARHILQIPLREGIDDLTARHFDSKGQHSVRNAYKLQVQLEKQGRGGAPGNSSTTIGNLDRCAANTVQDPNVHLEDQT